ncbi:MAG: hypothetical protein ACTS5I_07390 [Rhodanobacter sp.]
MTLPPLFGQGRRTRWLKVAIVAWLLLVSAITLVNSIGLSHVAEQTHHSEQEARFNALSARVADLVRQIDTSRRRPKPAAQAEFLAARHTLEGRLDRIEQTLTGTAYVDDIRALQARVTTVEIHQQQVRSAPTAAQTGHGHAAVKPKVPKPPFRVVGIDVRGGERFLSIAAPTTTSLADVRLLREGDSDSNWQLQSIETHAALFLVNGQMQRVVLP